MVQTHNLKQYTFNDVGPCGPLLHEIAWSIRSTHHTTNKVLLGQLVFGRDMLFDIQYTPDWDKIAEQKQNKINKSSFARRKIVWNTIM